MSYTYYNELIDQVYTPIAADRHRPVTAAEKPYMDRFEQEMTNATYNGLEPEYVFKLTMLICLLVKKGILAEVVQSKLNDILLHLQKFPLEVSDEYIDHIIETLFQ